MHCEIDKPQQPRPQNGRPAPSWQQLNAHRGPLAEQRSAEAESLRVHGTDARRKLPFMSSVRQRRRQLMRGECAGFRHPWFNDLLSPGCSARPGPRRSRSRHKGDQGKRSKLARARPPPVRAGGLSSSGGGLPAPAPGAAALHLRRWPHRLQVGRSGWE